MKFKMLINDLPKKEETVITAINENGDVNVVKLSQPKEELIAMYKFS